MARSVHHSPHVLFFMSLFCCNNKEGESAGDIHIFAVQRWNAAGNIIATFFLYINIYFQGDKGRERERESGRATPVTQGQTRINTHKENIIKNKEVFLF